MRQAVDRSGCREQVCTCHDDGAWRPGTYVNGCSQCGCQWGPPLPEPAERYAGERQVLVGAITGMRPAEPKPVERYPGERQVLVAALTAMRPTLTAALPTSDTLVLLVETALQLGDLGRVRVALFAASTWQVEQDILRKRADERRIHSRGVGASGASQGARRLPGAAVLAGSAHGDARKYRVSTRP